MSKARFYLDEHELGALVGQTVFVAPLCFGPTGVWIEGRNQKQVDRAMRFVEKFRETANAPTETTGDRHG